MLHLKIVALGAAPGWKLSLGASRPPQRRAECLAKLEALAYHLRMQPGEPLRVRPGKSTDRSNLIREIKELIVEALQLEDVKPEEIADSEPLFGSGLQLDSIDALELAMAIGRTYSVQMNQTQETRDAFRSVEHLAAYILRHRRGEAGMER